MLEGLGLIYMPRSVEAQLSSVVRCMDLKNEQNRSESFELPSFAHVIRLKNGSRIEPKELTQSISPTKAQLSRVDRG